jgi:hypothetical protein
MNLCSLGVTASLIAVMYQVNHNKLLQKLIHFCAALKYAITGLQNYIGAGKMDQ